MSNIGVGWGGGGGALPPPPPSYLNIGGAVAPQDVRDWWHNCDLCASRRGPQGPCSSKGECTTLAGSH